MATEEIERKTYTVAEAAKIIGICVKTARNMIAAGRLPVIRITPNKVVIPKEALHRWLEESVQWPKAN